MYNIKIYFQSNEREDSQPIFTLKNKTYDDLVEIIKTYTATIDNNNKFSILKLEAIYVGKWKCKIFIEIKVDENHNYTYHVSIDPTKREKDGPFGIKTNVEFNIPTKKYIQYYNNIPKTQIFNFLDERIKIK